MRVLHHAQLIDWEMDKPSFYFGLVSRNFEVCSIIAPLGLTTILMNFSYM